MFAVVTNFGHSYTETLALPASDVFFLTTFVLDKNKQSERDIEDWKRKH